MEWKVSQLAEHLGISSNRVHQLANDGMFKRLDGKKASFDSVKSIRAYIEHLRGKTKSAVEEKARLDKLRADKIEMENQMTRGERIDTEAATAAWSKVMQAFRARTLVIPTKAAPLLVGTKSAGEAQDILQRLINEALRELSIPDLVRVALDIQADKLKRNRKRRQS